MLWRTSSIIIAGGLATATVLYSGFYYVDDRLPIGMRDKIWSSLGVIISVLSTVSYVGARLYILIEAFISLRDLPAAAYQTPSWTPWLPHL